MWNGAVGGFRLDLRLPSGLFSKLPFVYNGPDFRRFNTGLVNVTVQHMGRMLWKAYPVTILEPSSRTMIGEVLFSFCFLNRARDGCRLLATHPVLLSEDCGKALHALLDWLELSASEAFLDGIEMEIHEPLGQTASFPTSYSAVSYRLDGPLLPPDLLEDLLRERGYSVRSSVLTYGIDLEGLRHPYEEASAFEADLHDLRSKGRLLPIGCWTLDTVDDSLRPTNVLKNVGRILSFKDGGRTLASMLILPDLFEPALAHRTPVPQIFRRKLSAFQFTGLKVVEWYADSMEKLASFALSIPRFWPGLNVRRVEVMGIPEELRSGAGALAALGFKELVRTLIYRKELV